MGEPISGMLLKEGEIVKILVLNAQGLITKNSKKKINYLEELTKNEKVEMINISETWYDMETGEDDKIEGYQVYRADRKNRPQGGTAIYRKDNIHGKIYEKFSNGECELIAVEFEYERSVNITIYRPPNAKDFEVITEKIKIICEKYKHWTILLTGDFNFPFVKWEEREGHRGCAYSYKSNMNVRISDKKQFENLMNVMLDYNMQQINHWKTRNENTLDLVFVNEINYIKDLVVYDTGISDHRVIELSIKILSDKLSKDHEIKEWKGYEMYNFYSDKINWKKVNEDLNINWDEILKDKNVKESTKKFYQVLEEIVEKHIPKKKDKKSI